MRGALLVLVLIAAGAVLVPASVADSPARARADASIVTGSLGDFGTLTARGDAERTDDEITVEDSGIVVGAAEALARASRAGGLGTARAVALARRIDLFDGLVTAKVARRTATTAATDVVYAGRIAGLMVEGRQIGDIRKPSRYTLSDGGSVVVNKGRARDPRHARRTARRVARGHHRRHRGRAGERRGRGRRDPDADAERDADADTRRRRRRPASAARRRRCASA